MRDYNGIKIRHGHGKSVATAYTIPNITGLIGFLRVNAPDIAGVVERDFLVSHNLAHLTGPYTEIPKDWIEERLRRELVNAIAKHWESA